MFWAGEKIKEFFPSETIVEPYDVARVDCNAYELSVGPEYFITSDHRRSFIDSGIRYFDSKRFLSKSASCVIPTGQFAFLITDETVRIPRNAMGFISLKTKKVKFKGLVNISGFHVDPGYHGKLVFAVFNAGPSSIHIRKGDRLFLLWLADLDVSRHRTTDSVDVKPDAFALDRLSSDLVSDVSDRLVSLQDMSQKIDGLQKQLFYIYAVVGSVVAVLVFFATIAQLFNLSFS